MYDIYKNVEYIYIQMIKNYTIIISETLINVNIETECFKK